METNTEPVIVIFEGPDYVGKTTFAKIMQEKIAERYGKKVHYFREPGSTESAEEIRQTIFKYDDLEDYTQALLFTACRIEAYNKEVFPKLRAGEIVVMDRSLVSTLVYQDNISQTLKISEPLLQHPLYMGTHIILCVLDANTDVLEKRREERGIENHLDTRDLQKLRSKYVRTALAISKLQLSIADTVCVVNTTDNLDENIKVISDCIFNHMDDILLSEQIDK